MSPPRINRSGDRFDQVLLRAGRNDGPPRGAEERALAGLGLSAGLSPRSIVERPSTMSPGYGAWPLKAIAIAMTLGAGGAGVWTGASRRPALAPVPPSVASVFEPAPPAAPETSAEGPCLTPPVAPTTDPSRASIHHAPRSPSIAPPARAAAASTVAPVQTAAVDPPPLSVEIALVQQAARALASGDAAVALSLLDTYDRQCPHGTLADEAGALRVQALARGGRATEAKALARQLLDAHPRGVLTPRLQGVLDGAPDAGRR